MKKRKKNNFLLTDNQMAEFVSKGYLIFNNIIDNKINKKFLSEIGHTSTSLNEKNTDQAWLAEHYNEIMKTSKIPLVKAGTPLKKAYKKNSALNDVINNPVLSGAIKSLVGDRPKLDHHFLHITFPSKYYHDANQKISQGNHNDCVIDSREKTFDIQLFYFPTAVEKNMGGTRYIPGSHFRMVNEMAIARYHNIRGQKHVVCPAGTVIIFHHNIWHGAGINNSKKIRYGFKIRLMPTQKQVKLWTNKTYKNNHEEEALYWNRGVEKNSIKEILQKTEPWFEADSGRLDILNRIRLWRHITNDKNFDAAYWLTRIENDYN